jgi:hypothetical protein
VNVLRSPRWRRRLGWSLATLAVVGAATAIGLTYSNTAERAPEAAPPPGMEAQVYKAPKHIELTRAQRARVLATAANFVTHAVARRKVEEAYDLTAPSLRGGLTRAQWRAGAIPVVPFPVEEARWKLEFSDEDAIGLQVLLLPGARSGLKPELFNMELAATGKGAEQRFLVTSWSPSGLGGGGVPAAASSGPGGLPNLGDAPGGQARLGGHWLLAPLVLLALVPLVVIGFFARGWLRGRRAAAEYAASAPVRDLPTLRR